MTPTHPVCRRDSNSSGCGWRHSPSPSSGLPPTSQVALGSGPPLERLPPHPDNEYITSPLPRTQDRGCKAAATLPHGAGTPKLGALTSTPWTFCLLLGHLPVSPAYLPILQSCLHQGHGASHPPLTGILCRCGFISSSSLSRGSHRHGSLKSKSRSFELCACLSPALPTSVSVTLTTATLPTTLPIPGAAKTVLLQGRPGGLILRVRVVVLCADLTMRAQKCDPRCCASPRGSCPQSSGPSPPSALPFLNPGLLCSSTNVPTQDSTSSGSVEVKSQLFFTSCVILGSPPASVSPWCFYQVKALNSRGWGPASSS